jgi:hypothetical protein
LAPRFHVSQPIRLSMRLSLGGVRAWQLGICACVNQTDL